ncbi:MAG: hypothetical protein KGQ41_02555 [Alphaproteobacteria bacterium]|nr:hypothetical protein [Alphaproteobacteria bacterium]
MSFISGHFRALRDRVMTYRDDFIRANTLARLNAIESRLKHHFEAAQGDDVYVLRAIAHYQGQCSIRDRFSLWVIEAVAAGLLLCAPFVFLAGAFKPKPAPQGARAFFMLLAPVNDTVAKLYKVPEQLKDTPTAKTYVPRVWRLNGDDRRIVTRLCVQLFKTRCPFPLQYVWKALKDMTLARSYLTAYPQAEYALVAGEYSCGITLNALQFRHAGKGFYNIMHGDNASTPMECFLKADRFYVWDDHFIGLLREQRIDAEFVVSPNPDFVLKAGERLSKTGIGVVVPMINFVPAQYAGVDDLLKDLGRVLGTTQGLTLRPHPAYPQTFDVLSAAIASPHGKSEPTAQSAHDFILNHGVIIGYYSTVLVEAAHLGVPTIILKSPGSVARAEYHGIFKMAHVRHVSLADLPATLEALISAEGIDNRGTRHVA